VISVHDIRKSFSAAAVLQRFNFYSKAVSLSCVWDGLRNEDEVCFCEEHLCEYDKYLEFELSHFSV